MSNKHMVSNFVRHDAKRKGGKTIQLSSNKHTLHSSSEHSQLQCNVSVPRPSIYIIL